MLILGIKGAGLGNLSEYQMGCKLILWKILMMGSLNK
jgi:hypothetical protein